MRDAVARAATPTGRLNKEDCLPAERLGERASDEWTDRDRYRLARKPAQNVTWTDI
jgi:hypothetical protein